MIKHCICDQEVMENSFSPLCPVTNEISAVLINRQWCSQATKVTVNLAIHYPCVADFCGPITYELKWNAHENPTYAPTGQWHLLSLPYLSYMQLIMTAYETAVSMFATVAVKHSVLSTTKTIILHWQYIWGHESDN